MRKEIIFIVGIALLLLVGGYYLGVGQSTSPEVPPDDTVAESWGSIFGTVLLGPTCPVMRDPPDPQCADKLYKTSLVVTTADGARVIKEFQSNAEGRFGVDLPPGEYSIHSAAAANVLPYCSSNGIVEVKYNDSIEVVISCDTGIR